MQSQTAIFSRFVKDFMRRKPLAVKSGTPLAEAVRQLAEQDVTACVVTGENNTPLGIVTNHDVARRVAFKAAAGAPVDQAMSAPVHQVESSDYLYHAIARMRRLGLRHMAVVDGAGALVGMLDLHDALAVVSDRLMGQIDRLTREDSLEGLKHIKAAQVDLARELFADNLPASEIQGLLTHINNDIYRRVVDLNLKAMAAAGEGSPPVRFCLIVMGSGGRGENYLFPDQDNGIILEDFADGRHREIDDWFIALAERVTKDLDAVGIPLCKGYVMATNPLWRKTLAQWKEQMRLWSRKRDLTALRLCDIFFDFRPVWGEADLARDLRRHVTRVAKESPMFLREMYEDDVEHRVALGLFGRFITEKMDREFLGQINLKHTGTLPLVEAVRLLALREGIEDVSTLGRLDALHRTGFLEADEYDYLKGAFHHVCRLLLRQQINDFKAGSRVSNYVDPGTLSRREKDMLVDSFKAIRTLRDRVKSEFTADIF